MLTPDGDARLRYHKMRLVPFGEYVPLQSVLTLGGRYSREAGGARWAEFTPGTDTRSGAVDGHRARRLHLLRGHLPRPACAEFTARGAELLVNITNDAWYGRTSAPHQHFAMASFRAVENGKYLVRAANTGHHRGGRPARAGCSSARSCSSAAVLVREVPLVPGITFYAPPRRRVRLGLPGGGRSPDLRHLAALGPLVDGLLD